MLINNLWKIIINDLDLESLRAMSCVDKNFNKLCQPKELWKKNLLKVEDEKIFEMLKYAEEFLENPYRSFYLAKVNKNNEGASKSVSSGPGMKKKKKKENFDSSKDGYKKKKNSH